MSSPAQFGNTLFGVGEFGGTNVALPDTGLIPLVRQMIDQTGPAGDVFWSAQALYDAANEVVMDFWAAGNRSGEYVQIANTPFVIGSGADIVAFSTTSIMIPQFIVLNTTTANSTINQVYFISDRTKLEQWNRYWRTNQQTQPRWFILWDNFNIRCFPQADQTYTFTLWGVPWPNEISSTQEDIIVNGVVVDRMFKLAMAYKVASNLLLYTRPDVSQAYVKLSEEGMSWYRRRLRLQGQPKIHRLKPGVSSRQDAMNMGATKGVFSIGRHLS
jgi:hypothetical protein